ncbi:MAG: copper chaperone PCu(A)C [Rhodobacteraceae bacterium]|nr:copper chaperone PCu(A)C [Paracoccaceae bacterium]
MTLKTLATIAISMLISLGAAQAQDIHIEDAYARAASPIAKSGAAFMHIMNMGDVDDRLIAVRTDVAMMPELHTHIMEDGVAKMREVEGGFEIIAGGATILERGSLHIMLMALTRPMLHGDVITLTLIFEKSGELTIEVPVDNERQGNMNMNMDHSNMNGATMDHSTMENSTNN